MGGCPEAIVADLVKALGEDVLKESSHEFLGRKRHGAPTISRGILILEGNGVVGDVRDSAVGNGHAMDITGKIG